MINVTFSVDSQALVQVRKRALNQDTTLNEEVRAWLKQYGTPLPRERFKEIMKQAENIVLVCVLS